VDLSIIQWRQMLAVTEQLQDKIMDNAMKFVA